MKVVKSTDKSFVVNSKGKRLTPKYSLINAHKYGPFYIADCHDDYYEVKKPKPDIIFVFDSKTEARLMLGIVEDCTKISENLFALKIEGEWHFYDDNMVLLKKGATHLYKCDNHPYIMVTVDEQKYFWNHSLEAIAGPFYATSPIGPFGHAIVTLKVDEQLKKTVLTLIDGKLVLKPWAIECDGLEVLSNGFFVVTKNGAYGVIDSDGNEILPTIYQSITPKDHHFVIQYNEKYGLADITGKIIFECFYDEIMETPDKYAVKDFARLETSKTIEVPK